MKKEMWNKKMPEITQSCERASDLVAYLYGEASADEARDFKSHLNACHACRAEMSAFTEVREAVGTWREQALHPMTSTTMETNAARARKTSEAAPKRSALAALREFFTHSPMWLRGATAFAALLLIALMVITVMHFSERKDSTLVRQATPAAPAPPEQKAAPVVSPEQIAVLPQEKQPTVKAKEKINRVEVAKNNSRASRNMVAGNKQKRQPALVPDSINDESLQLREIVMARDESDDNIPRLYDLISDSN
ncbi:MAG TPA: zf-HC2 domain-containing protein [Pyrinomonadaceae bacterium]|jgi:hypothetical protein